jgi:hypothetical protein
VTSAVNRAAGTGAKTTGTGEDVNVLTSGTSVIVASNYGADLTVAAATEDPMARPPPQL